MSEEKTKKMSKVTCDIYQDGKPDEKVQIIFTEKENGETTIDFKAKKAIDVRMPLPYETIAMLIMEKIRDEQD